MAKYALNIGENGRILSATYDRYGAPGQPRVDVLPEGYLSDYDFSDGQCVLNEARKAERIATREALENTPSPNEILSARLDYIAMMTGVEL